MAKRRASLFRADALKMSLLRAINLASLFRATKIVDFPKGLCGFIDNYKIFRGVFFEI